MKFVRINNTDNDMFAPAMELYGMSFPYNEQREPDSQARIMSDPEYHFELIYDEDRFVGEILSWENADFIYVEHFCMLPDVRGRGCGSRALELLRARGKTIILEIDPPVDDISRRRKGFYERNGFIANDYDYTHLPYHRGCKGHRLVIMSSPRKISEAEYGNFLDYMRRRVMVF